MGRAAGNRFAARPVAVRSTRPVPGRRPFAARVVTYRPSDVPDVDEQFPAVGQHDT
jgi:hypothetical protein